MIKNPIVHCITNYVAMDLTANALLAIGARPLMSSALPEMEDIAKISDSLLINIGTLDDAFVEAALVAGKAMRDQGKPIILDPVGVQVSSYRMKAVLQIIQVCQPCVIKGNASEIQALAERLTTYPGVVVTTGEVDVIAQGHRKELLSGGSPLMTQVTAMGCTAGAVIAAMTAVEPNPFVAACRAMKIMNKVGEQAITNIGISTYRQRFLDYLSHYA